MVLQESHRLRDRFPNHPITQQSSLAPSWSSSSSSSPSSSLTERELDDSLFVVPPQTQTLETASKAVFEFLKMMSPTKESDNIEINSPKGRVTNLLWLSDKTCLSNNSSLHRQGLDLKLVFHIEIYTHQGEYSEIYFYRNKCKPPLTITTTYLVDSVDRILLLLAKHKTASKINLVEYTFIDEPTPFSFNGLKAYVSEAQSPRVLDFENFMLTREEWQVLLFHCNPNVMLSFMDQWRDCGSVVIESIRGSSNISSSASALQQQCLPSRLDLSGLDTIPEKMFQDLVTALAYNTTLLELKLTRASGKSSHGDDGGGDENGGSTSSSTVEYRMMALYEAISRNQCLEKLSLSAPPTWSLVPLKRPCGGVSGGGGGNEIGNSFYTSDGYNDENNYNISIINNNGNSNINKDSRMMNMMMMVIMSDGEWEAFWSAVASHPTLTSVELVLTPFCSSFTFSEDDAVFNPSSSAAIVPSSSSANKTSLPQSLAPPTTTAASFRTSTATTPTSTTFTTTSPERDQVLVNAIRSNKAGVLCELVVSKQALYDVHAVQEQIRPILEHNRMVYYYSITTTTTPTPTPTTITPNTNTNTTPITASKISSPTSASSINNNNTHATHNHDNHNNKNVVFLDRQ